MYFLEGLSDTNFELSDMVLELIKNYHFGMKYVISFLNDRTLDLSDHFW